MNLIWKLIAAVVSQPRVVDALIKRAQRTPYSNITSSDGQDVYMYRWWLFNPYSEDSGIKTGAGSEQDNRRWSWLPSIRIHRIMREDQDRDFHDHPWNARTIVLRGGYTEALPGQPYLRTRLPGMTGRLLFGEYHRITSVSAGGVWTLFFTWKYQGTWGFLVDGKKVPWRDYLGKNTVSPGSAISDAPESLDPTAAVIEAARQWSADREIQDWSEAELMKTIATLDGDWPGCDDCQFDCDEPCMPSTVAQFHRAIDCQVAQLVHDGKLPKYEGYEPPQGFVPTQPRRKRIPIASHHQQ